MRHRSIYVLLLIALFVIVAISTLVIKSKYAQIIEIRNRYTEMTKDISSEIVLTTETKNLDYNEKHATQLIAGFSYVAQCIPINGYNELIEEMKQSITEYKSVYIGYIFHTMILSKMNGIAKNLTSILLVLVISAAIIFVFIVWQSLIIMINKRKNGRI